MKQLLVRVSRDDRGQDVIEYALLAAFISVLAIVLIGQIGTGVNTMYNTVQNAVATAPS
jgi:pilus assembly protein Flp/PilA